jgi:hypothetical protein
MAKKKFASSWDAFDVAEVARDHLRKEVKAGRIVKPDQCQLCGTDGLLFGHHWRGYAFPLDVWWVCISCNTVLKVHDGSQSFESARRIVKTRPGKRKTDNSNLAAKLDLRRYFLRTYHATEPIHVLDCCQGAGVLWRQLRQEFPVASYWGLDVKPKKGRLRLDSVRVLAQPGWPQNVIDVDTYGSPWAHWLALLPNVVSPTTVFLTVGQPLSKPFIRRFRSLNKEELQSIGASFKTKLPLAFQLFIGKLSTPYVLAAAYKAGVQILEAVEAESTGNANYFGVRLEKSVGARSADTLRDGPAVPRPSAHSPRPV